MLQNPPAIMWNLKNFPGRGALNAGRLEKNGMGGKGMKEGKDEKRNGK